MVIFPVRYVSHNQMLYGDFYMGWEIYTVFFWWFTQYIMDVYGDFYSILEFEYV